MNKQNNNLATAIRSVTGLLGGETIESSKILTVQNFFDRYMTADELADYIKLLRMSAHGITYMEVFFHNVCNGLTITNPVLPRKDKGGNLYAWTTFSNNEGTKVVISEPIIAFINDYRNKLIKPDFDFYSLVEQMTKIKTVQD